MCKSAPTSYLTCQKGEQLHKGGLFFFFSLFLFSPQSGAADTASVEEDESFAFTSNGDERSGRGSVGENEGGLRSSCTSWRRH